MSRHRLSLLALLYAVSAFYASFAQAEFHVWIEPSGRKHISSIPRTGFTANGMLAGRHNPNSIVFQQRKMIARLNEQAVAIAALEAEKARAAETIEQPSALRRIAPREGTMNLDQLIDLEKRGGRYAPIEAN